MKTNYEYIVLGLGGIGSGAAYWLARRFGNDVLGLEQFEIGHVRGGSQDHSRIIRLSYHTPAYVAYAKLAYQAWAGLEDDIDDALIIKTGGIDLWPQNSVIDPQQYSASLSAEQVPFERLDAAEIRHRWPQFQVSDNVTALFQTESGIAPAARCNAAHVRMARAHGADLRERVTIHKIATAGSEIMLDTSVGRFHCGKLVMAAGAWSNHHLAHFGLQLPLTVTQEQVTYYNSPQQDQYQIGRFPIWIWMDEPCFYGFPVYGEAAIKIAQDAGGREVTAETRSFEPDAEQQKRVDDFTRRILPTAFGPILYSKTCLYTMPPDRDFIIDTLPDHPNIALAIGAGHAFKFASVIGKTLGELVADGTTAANLAPFKLSRPILHMQNPPKNFMQ